MIDQAYEKTNICCNAKLRNKRPKQKETTVM